MQQRVLSRRPVRACVFCGPSAVRDALPAGIDVYPPATRGTLAAAARSGYNLIGFIDGAIDPLERVTLTELRHVLGRSDVLVIGGASMGAVRAVQLESAGMRGVGRIYRLFRRGSLSDSDEVYLLHAPAALRYRSLTLPLVNIRYTLRAMRRARHISGPEEGALLGYIRDVPWFDRDRQALTAAAYGTFGSARSNRIVQTFERMYRDVKREDALLLMRDMKRGVQKWK